MFDRTHVTCSNVYRWPVTLRPPQKTRSHLNRTRVRWLVRNVMQNPVPTLPFPLQGDYYKLCPNCFFPSLNQIQCSQEQQLKYYWHGFYFKITTSRLWRMISRGKLKFYLQISFRIHMLAQWRDVVKIIHNFLFLTE